MNKSTLASAAVILGLLGAAGCAVTEGQSTVGQYVDDKTITARVKTRFASDKEVSATKVQVETLNGTVQLSGFVPTAAEKQRAGEIARAVPDVKDVRNNIVVQP